MTVARFPFTRAPVPQDPAIAAAVRVINDNFQRLQALLDRAIAGGNLIPDGSITEAMLSADAKELAGPDVTGEVGASGSTLLSANAKTLLGDVTGTTGSAGSTTVGKIKGVPVDAPAAGDDGQVLTYDHGGGVLSWEAPAGGASGDGRVDRTPAGTVTLLDGESLVAVDYYEPDVALELDGDSVLEIL